MQKTKTFKRRKRRKGNSSNRIPKNFGVGKKVVVEMTKTFDIPYEVVMEVKDEKIVTAFSTKPKVLIKERYIRRKETATKSDIVFESKEYWLLARAFKQKRRIPYEINSNFIKNTYVLIINST